MNTTKWYAVVNRATNQVFDIVGVSTELGAALTQWQRTDAFNQQFRFIDSGSDYYRLIARHTGFAVDIFEFNADDGADVVQWTDLNGENQQFHMLDLQNGYYHIRNRLTGKVLTPEANSDAAGTRITQYSRSGDLAQQWRLVEVDDYTPSMGGGDFGECGAGTPKAVVTGGPGNYQMNGVNYGGDYSGAVLAALGALTPGRTQQERVSIMADGDVGSTRINLQSNTIFEVCGTMNVGAVANRGSISIWGSHTENISIPYLKMTGTPWAAMLIADTDNLHLGQIDMRMSGGLGIRFDRDRNGSNNVRMDNIYVEGTGGHGVETWNIDGLEIGTVTARNTAYAGLLLNNTRNATIDLVDGEGTGSGTGYATMRFANSAGNINGSYPTNIFVNRIVSRGGGRGIFCVSQSGGIEINSIDLSNNGNNSALIENCYNVKINGGSVNGGGEFRISARSEFDNTRDVTVSNLQVSGTTVRECPPADNMQWINLNVPVNGC